MLRKVKTVYGWAIALLLVSSLTACQKDPEIVTLSGKTMGTTYHIKYITAEASQSAADTHEGVEKILKDVNDKMSTYIPTSELSRFNQNRAVNTPIEISADLAKVIGEAIRLNKVTQGALDVTVGPLVNLWGFGPEKRVEKAPTQQQLDERRAWVGIEKLTLSESAGKFYLEKAVPELYVDLSSIAKGFGVDQVADYLESLHIGNYMVEIGGEIRAKGNNSENKPWQIAIEKPTMDGSRGVEQVVGLHNLAMATSGDYRIYFEENGVRYSHEINPQTGRPIQHHLASITVLDPSSMTADGLSTGLFVLGEDEALKVAEQQQLAVYLIIKTESGFEVKMSSAFKQLINP
ncbi:FAD:protein FMN transferase [Avibacterium paragallinarum]|uniref:FAD:protein FMN transferase n=1 Tax=Avibacterium paragallinarum TaxID=728 RepID=UPI0021F7130D|nr:FAD:protein FMN transferase [Avibacterium paragallinarum]UXN36788.1 FAD:protein FMN transferase [Avibacterium paragallinarum]